MLNLKPSEDNSSCDSSKLKGLVLSGGRGTRLAPLTNFTSKQLLLVGGKALVLYPIETLLNAGVKDIFLLIDHRNASQYMELLKDGAHLGIRSLTYLWQPEVGAGLPSAINQIEPFLRSDEKLIVICGDMIIEGGINSAVDDFSQQEKGARLCMAQMLDTAGYSPILTAEHLVTQIESKDKNRHSSGFIDLGVYMFHHDVFQRTKTLKPSSRGETEIWDLHASYISDNCLSFSTVEGWWSDVGSNIETYLLADAHFSN